MGEGQGDQGEPRCSFPTPVRAPPFLQVWLPWVLTALRAMETILASSLAKVMSAASLAKAGGRPVLGSVLAGLKSAGECSWEGWWGFKEAAGDREHREGPTQGLAGTERVASPPVASRPCPALPWHLSWLFLGGGPEGDRTQWGGSSGGLLPTLPPDCGGPCLAPALWPSLPLDSPQSSLPCMFRPCAQIDPWQQFITLGSGPQP